MTLEEVRKRVAEIVKGQDDPEEAHYAEDRLREDLLSYLAEVAPAELGELAKLAVSTSELDFMRWYA